MVAVVDVEITSDDIRAAKSGETWAIELTLGTMDSRIRTLASNEAKQMLAGGMEFWTEEFRQVGYVAMWAALPRFEGEDPDVFRGYMYRTAELEIRAEARANRYPGTDEDAVKTFGYWVEQCEGDMDLAEQMSQRFPDKYGRKLGRDRANAARMAYMIPSSIDAQIKPEWGDSAPLTYAELLISTLGIPEDLITSDDLSRLESKARHEMTHAVLAAMGDGAASVLRYTFGIDGYSAYGVDANAEIGGLVGKTAKQVIDARTKGYKAFATKYIKLLAAQETDPEVSVMVADDWWEAFHAERARSNARGHKL